MKIIVHILRAIILLMTLWFLTQGSFAYAPETTHAGLTQEVIRFYEALGGDTMTPDEQALLIQGSIDEDNPETRCINHFYDPISGEGLNNNQSSVVWATNDTSWNEFTWNKGIEAYARGDEHKAMIVLGHILHLVEDASVPDHTRNDSHKGDGLAGLYTNSSPFEQWTNAHEDRTTLDGVGKKLAGDGMGMNGCSDIRSCFLFMATYSNGNFFSRDTITETSFQSPIQTSEDNYYGYGIDSLSGQRNKLFMRTLDKNNNISPVLSDGRDYSVISENFERITPQVISVGARVIDLFMTEAKFARAELLKKEHEAKKQAVDNQIVLHERLKNAGFFGQLAFGFTDIFVTTPVSKITSVGNKFVSAGSTIVEVVSITLLDGTYKAKFEVRSVQLAEIAVLDATGEVVVSGAKQTVAVAKKTGDKIQDGVTSAMSEAQKLAELVRSLESARQMIFALSRASSQVDAIVPAGEVAGAATERMEPAPYVLHANSLSSGGGASGGIKETIESPKTVIFLADETVITPPVLPEATTTEEVVELIPSIPPAAPVVLSPLENEVVATTTVIISGTAESNHVVALSWEDNGATIVFETRASSTGAWSAHVLMPVGTSVIGVVVLGEDDLISETTLRSIIVELPVEEVIESFSRVMFNEVGWSGTIASPNDEWIELYNAGNTAADLSQYRLSIATGSDSKSIALSGIIEPGEYFVVMNMGALTEIGPMVHELLDDELSLADEGVDLSLAQLTDEGDITVDFLPRCVDWCGYGGEGQSMERWRTDKETTVSGNWGASDGNFSNALDRNGDWVYGTPGVRNSLNYQFSLTNTIEGLEDFSNRNTLYVIYTTLTIPAGSSLTLGPGTVVKWQSRGAQIIVHGALSTTGTITEPVIFTSVFDDSVLGDTMDNGNVFFPVDSGQKGITASGASSTVNLVNTEIKYAGTAISLHDHANVQLASTTISDTKNAINVFSSNLNGTSTTFRDLSGNVISAFATSTIVLASTSVARTYNDAFVLFNSSLEMSTTSMSGVHGIGFDVFGSSLSLSNTNFNELIDHKKAINLFADKGKASTGIIDGLFVPDAGLREVLYMSGSNATMTNSVLKSGDQNAILMYNNSNLFIASSTISDFAEYGIIVSNSSLDAQGVSLLDNKQGINSWRGEVEIHNSVISGNIVGIQNHRPTEGNYVDATENYWGDPDGPTTPGMPLGTEGDAVSINVLTDPFLQSSPIVDALLASTTATTTPD